MYPFSRDSVQQVCVITRKISTSQTALRWELLVCFFLSLSFSAEGLSGKRKERRSVIIHAIKAMPTLLRENSKHGRLHSSESLCQETSYLLGKSNNIFYNCPDEFNVCSIFRRTANRYLPRNSNTIKFGNCTKAAMSEHTSQIISYSCWYGIKAVHQ